MTFLRLNSKRDIRHFAPKLNAFVGIAASILLVGCTNTEYPEVFDSTILHEVTITVDATHLDQLAVDLENRVPGTIVYDGKELVQVGIRQKGNTAIPLDQKPSFSVDFDEFDSKGDLHGFHKILLNSSKQDPTFLREKLASEAHARAGLPASRMVHAHVTFNGADAGLYVVAEAVDKDFLQLHFGKDFDQGNLYEGPCCGDFAIDTGYRTTQLTLDDEVKDGRTRDDVNLLAKTIVSAPDATFAADMTKVLDLEQYMKIYALEVLLMHWDGYAFRGNNYYLYDNPADSRFVFFPHGMDRILDDLSFQPTVQNLAARLPARIRSNPMLDAQFQDLFTQLSLSAWDKTAMTATIDSTVKMLHQAPAGPQTTKDLTLLDAELNGLQYTIKLYDAQLHP